MNVLPMTVEVKPMTTDTGKKNKIDLFDQLPIDLSGVLEQLVPLSTLISIQFSEAVLNCEHLHNNKRANEIRAQVLELLSDLASDFRGIRLICTRLGLTAKDDRGSVEVLVDKYAILRDFSIKYAPDSGIMSILLLIEKNEDRSTHYSLDAVHVSEGTVMFPSAQAVLKTYNQVFALVDELEEIAKPKPIGVVTGQGSISAVVSKRSK